MGPRTLLLWGSRGYLQPTFPGGPKEPNSSLPASPLTQPLHPFSLLSPPKNWEERRSQAGHPHRRTGKAGGIPAGGTRGASAKGPVDPGEGTEGLGYESPIL